MAKQNYRKGTKFRKKVKWAQAEINVSDTNSDSVTSKIAQIMKLMATERKTSNVTVCESGISQVYQDQMLDTNALYAT